MATTKEEGKFGCPALHAEGLNYHDLKAILELQKNPETTIRYLEGRITFNHQDISREWRWMEDEYARENIIGFGYALGDTLRKHDGHG